METGKISGRTGVSKTSSVDTGAKVGKTSNDRSVSIAKPSFWARFKAALGFKAKISNPVPSGASIQSMQDKYGENFIKAGPEAKHPGGFVSADEVREKAEKEKAEVLASKLEDRIQKQIKDE